MAEKRGIYNLIAGKSLERIAALSDGLFAIAMTLIVLDIRVPPGASIHSEADLGHALLALSRRIVMYLVSFLTLGIFWVGQQTQLNYLARADRVAWIRMAFLACVATMPFSTTFLAEFIGYRPPQRLGFFCVSERDAPGRPVSHRLSSSVRYLFEIVRVHNGQ